MRPFATVLFPPAPVVTGVHVLIAPQISMADVEETLNLSRLAIESLHGPERVELEVRYAVDAVKRTVTIDTAGAVGRRLAIVFLGYVKREFGQNSARVVRTGLVGSGDAQ